MRFSTAEKLEIDEIPFISTAPKPGGRKLWNTIRALQDKKPEY